jgi:hypothetical protein
MKLRHATDYQHEEFNKVFITLLGTFYSVNSKDTNSKYYGENITDEAAKATHKSKVVVEVLEEYAHKVKAAVFNLLRIRADFRDIFEDIMSNSVKNDMLLKYGEMELGSEQYKNIQEQIAKKDFTELNKVLDQIAEKLKHLWGVDRSNDITSWDELDVFFSKMTTDFANKDNLRLNPHMKPDLFEKYGPSPAPGDLRTMGMGTLEYQKGYNSWVSKIEERKEKAQKRREQTKKKKGPSN